MDQVMEIVNLNYFTLFKKGVEELGQQSNILDCENKRLELKVKILKDSNDVCEY